MSSLLVVGHIFLLLVVSGNFFHMLNLVSFTFVRVFRFCGPSLTGIGFRLIGS